MLFFFRYIYLEEVDLNEENAFGILYAAKKYLVGGLVSKTLSYLRTSLSPSNVCAYLDNAFLMEEDCPEMMALCATLIQRDTPVVMHSESFYEVNRDSLCRILEMPRLSMPEVDVFSACEHWARRKCNEHQLAENPKNMRELLGRALHLIHLPVLSMDQFTKVVRSGLLTTEEENMIFRYFGGSHKDSTPEHLPFPTTMRSFVSGRASIQYPSGFVKHVTSFTSLYQGLPQRTRWSMSFQCDHSIKLLEIGLLGAIRGTLTVQQGGERKLEVTSHAHSQVIKLEEDPPLLDAGVVFTVSSESPFSYSGEYFSKAHGSNLPMMSTDHHQVTMAVRDYSTLCFLAFLSFVPTDELHFVENYYSDVPFEEEDDEDEEQEQEE